MIVVVDYGMGNLRSVSKALESLGASVRVSSEPMAVAAADKLILPGVGAFPAAMRELSARKLVEPIKRFIASGKPYLGICLGLQLLFESSEEGEGAAGLGVLKGTVKRFAPAASRKIPHMGWNDVRRPGARDGCPLLRDVPDGSFVYFVHSYYAEPAERAVTALETDYGVRFAAMVCRDSLFATQFHPEKSQAIGLRLLKNFIALPMSNTSLGRG
ncbi:MAG: imidazole glycerol phosphate synthase subunit HisH [Candidatus Omnitrophica bacterium]|nr:imidazole glycerol phosphate synthase subunit HisH [Candidatus Omnitrophota bacterium]